MIKLKRPRYSIICLIIYFVLLTAFLGGIFFFSDNIDFIQAWKNGETFSFSSGWELDYGGEVNLTTVRAGRYGGSVVLVKDLPDLILSARMEHRLFPCGQISPARS